MRGMMPWLVSVGLLALSLAMTGLTGRLFHGAPPAYHDEYSYLFQARTFLSGRLFFPADERSSFFTQMHVLHDNGVFASRYFPGVGLWLAPWIAAGLPYWGQYLAEAGTVVLLFWIGRELPTLDCFCNDERQMGGSKTARFATGFGAALACALSPGFLLFGNSLLSHPPTTFGLFLFVYCYMRALRSESILWPLFGGLALCLAMCCRPLTAFGFSLPFAIYLAIQIMHGAIPRCLPRLAAAFCPIVVGLIGLAAYNAKLTGNPFESPYGLYTRIYTPNHRYGFYNVSRSEQEIGPKVLDNYNRWATDLTPTRAIALCAERLGASAAWTIGRITAAWLAGLLLVTVWWLPAQWKLIVAAFIGVHAAYFAYGFEGIFGLSYVFETIPLIYLVAIGSIVSLVQRWAALGRTGRIIWLVLLIVFNVNDPALRLIQGVSEIQFARQYYAEFERRLDDAKVHAPALVVIRPDPDDRHRDLVTNSPSLDDPILRARYRSPNDIVLLERYFPDRHMWYYDAKFRILAPVKSGMSSDFGRVDASLQRP
jgi:hypothetical protein